MKQDELIYPCDEMGLGFAPSHCAPPAGYKENGYNCIGCPIKRLSENSV